MEKTYYAVIFTSQRTEGDNEAYNKMNVDLAEILKSNPDFIKEEGTRNDKGFGVSISYWKTLKAAKLWKQDALHKQAQELGKTKWYTWFNVRICEVQREYEWEK